MLGLGIVVIVIVYVICWGGYWQVGALSWKHLHSGQGSRMSSWMVKLISALGYSCCVIILLMVLKAMVVELPSLMDTVEKVSVQGWTDDMMLKQSGMTSYTAATATIVIMEMGGEQGSPPALVPTYEMVKPTGGMEGQAVESNVPAFNRGLVGKFLTSSNPEYKHLTTILTCKMGDLKPNMTYMEIRHIAERCLMKPDLNGSDMAILHHIRVFCCVREGCSMGELTNVLYDYQMGGMRGGYTPDPDAVRSLLSRPSIMSGMAMYHKITFRMWMEGGVLPSIASGESRGIEGDVPGSGLSMVSTTTQVRGVGVERTNTLVSSPVITPSAGVMSHTEGMRSMIPVSNPAMTPSAGAMSHMEMKQSSSSDEDMTTPPPLFDHSTQRFIYHSEEQKLKGMSSTSADIQDN
uniref:Orf405 n=1 Tax=Petrobiona massiliana TaxID=68578 RepID=A0A140CUT8_9METZ|nr:orf405 [Petrobiona massiliana]